MIGIPELNGNLFPLFIGSGDANAVVKTLTGITQLVFSDVLASDEIVEFWAEEDFSYCISASPTAVAASSHRLSSYSSRIIIIPAGCNMAIISGNNGKKFYLSK